MKLQTLSVTKSVIAVFTAITLFASCENTSKNIKRLNLKDEAPVGDGVDTRTVYTDSGKVVAILKAPRMLNFSNFEFGYVEFPDGVDVEFFQEGKKNHVTADYAIQYEGTNLIDLRKNVVIKTHDSVELLAKQLYWDQDRKWVFTNQPYQIKFKDGSYNDGASFDSNEDFTNFISKDNQGVRIMEKDSL